MYIQCCLDMNYMIALIPLAAGNGWINMAVCFRFHVYKKLGRCGAMLRPRGPWLRCYSCHYSNLQNENNKTVRNRFKRRREAFSPSLRPQFFSLFFLFHLLPRFSALDDGCWGRPRFPPSFFHRQIAKTKKKEAKK